MNLKFKTLYDESKLPTYGTQGAACFDFYAAEAVTIEPGQSATVSFGVAAEIPDGHVMLIYSRSGHGFKHGVRLSNCVGVIDSDYRGPLMGRLHNDGPLDFHVEVGDRVAQGMIMSAPRCTLSLVDELSDTARGAGGFGSTGK